MSATALNPTVKKPKKFGIEDLRTAKDGHVYVLNNTTNISRNNEVKIVAMTISAPGGPRSLVVHATWIPTDLSAQIAKEDILKSPDFLMAVDRRLIKLLSTEEAQELLSGEDAELESQRLVEQMNNIGPLDEEEDEKDEDTEKKMRDDRRKPPSARDTMTKEEKRLAKLNPSIVDMCTRDDMQPTAVFSQLKMKQTGLNYNDVLHLSANLPATSRNDRVNKLIAELLAKLSNKTEEDDGE